MPIFKGFRANIFLAPMHAYMATIFQNGEKLVWITNFC